VAQGLRVPIHDHPMAPDEELEHESGRGEGPREFSARIIRTPPRLPRNAGYRQSLGRGQAPRKGCRHPMAVRLVVNDRAIDASLAAVCGAYCGACPVYSAWAAQDLPRLEALARDLGTTTDRLMCTGCRTPAAFCFGGDCEIKVCARKRGVAFCPDCADYPCERIGRFDAGAPYRAEIRRDAATLRAGNASAWLMEQDRKWRCSSCGARVPAGSESCPACSRALPPA
jgi:hypothetical protein